MPTAISTPSSSPAATRRRIDLLRVERLEPAAGTGSDGRPDDR
ncbi:MAG: hypothetical protein ACK5SI_06950 [Planctomycetia bacterium]